MSVKGLRQTNLFGGEDSIPEPWKKELEKLKNSKKKIIKARIELEVPECIPEEELQTWIAYSISSMYSTGFICDTPFKEALSRIEPEVINVYL